ncbi:metallophosphoesterase [Bacillus sp. sid0103]|uniref:metallophosphoesterase n=1 Tax=Bacillus sp. sid0103 TaxID=2856337 RepID=UPI001C43B33B|nr:metallophosphoesterase [Bacillus sp. sid0103]MBV7505002.1 metallophosphoesterase [Bacillus sp. sid0103]
MRQLCFLIMIISFFLYDVNKVQAKPKYFYYQNNSLEINEMDYISKKIPSKFDGYTIVQLSDLHSKVFRENQKVLYQKVKLLKPDLIVFTGDLVDQKNYNEEASLMLMREINKIAPVYFVTGNHECWSGNFSSLEKSLNNIGIK